MTYVKKQASKRVSTQEEKFAHLKKWLISGGAEVHKNVKLKLISDSNRGIEAKESINKGECIMFIPKSSFVSFDQAADTELAQKLKEGLKIKNFNIVQ